MISLPVFPANIQPAPELRPVTPCRPDEPRQPRQNTPARNENYLSTPQSTENKQIHPTQPPQKLALFGFVLALNWLRISPKWLRIGFESALYSIQPHPNTLYLPQTSHSILYTPHFTFAGIKVSMVRLS